MDVRSSATTCWPQKMAVSYMCCFIASCIQRRRRAGSVDGAAFSTGSSLAGGSSGASCTMTLTFEASVDASLSESRARARVQGASLREILRGRCFPSMGGGMRARSPSTGVCTPAPDTLLSVGTRSSRPLLLASSSCRTTLRLPSACSDDEGCQFRGRGLPSVDGRRVCAVDACRLGGMQTERRDDRSHARSRPVDYLHTRRRKPWLRRV